LKTTASPDIPIAQGPLTSEEQARIKAYLDKELRAADQEIEEIERALRVVNRAIEDNENEFKRELGRLSGPPYRPRRETGFGRSYTPLHHRIPPTPLRTPRFPSVIGDYGIDSIEARNRADEERDKSRDESNRNWEKLRKKWDRDWKKGQEEWDRAWDRWREEWDKVGNARLRRLNDRIAAEKPRLDREALYRVLLLSALVLSTAWLSAVLAAFLQSYWGGDN
jgi:ferric-dicitrate binding protein FerR (iron transport regulator)